MLLVNILKRNNNEEDFGKESIDFRIDPISLIIGCKRRERRNLM